MGTVMREFSKLLGTAIVGFSLLACGGSSTPAEPTVGLANPASVNCDDKGGTLEIRKDPQGAESGYCLFADGTECEEWAYFRNECKPGDVPQAS